MANPLVSQGVLNRLRGSVIVVDIPQLTVTAPYLGQNGIGLALEGEATTYLPTLTGAATSPEPYQMISLTVHLLKTQFLADLYKSRQEANTFLGSIVVRPDATNLADYYFVNCAIKNIAPLNFSGKDAGYEVTIGGVYQINGDLYGQS